MEQISSTPTGRLAFVSGRLGLNRGSATQMFGLSESVLLPVAATTDDLGFLHEQFAVVQGGLPVVGGDLRLHTDIDGQIVAIGGVEWSDESLDDTPEITAEQGRDIAFGATLGANSASDAQLVYVVPSSGSDPVLAWQVRITGFQGEMPIEDLVFIDAISGAVADRHPQIHTARLRQTYDAQNGENTGTLVRSEGQGPTGDPDIDAAHNAAGETYDCLQQLFGRDSYDGAGATLRSVGNFGNNFANAFWDGSRMYYGDNFAVSDVGTHEFVHAVTERTANLVYQNQPGALNEAFSDIMAAVCDVNTKGQISQTTWSLGEDLPINALRFMNNPTADGISSDYFPERYTGQQDNGGVHLNSGIANLAFVLLTEGGTHPRQKTQVEVVGVGITKSAQIAYRALTVYLGTTSNFAAARVAMAAAADDLYGESERISVEEAWAAVGVGAAPSERPDPVVEPPADDPVGGTNPNGGVGGAPRPLSGGCNSAGGSSSGTLALLVVVGFGLIRRRRDR